MQILWQKKQTIDLGRVGHLSGLHPALTSLDMRTLHDIMSAFAVAQGMLQGIGGGQTESALTVRTLNPNLDLSDSQATPQLTRDRAPASIVHTSAPTSPRSGPQGSEYLPDAHAKTQDLSENR